MLAKKASLQLERQSSSCTPLNVMLSLVWITLLVRKPLQCSASGTVMDNRLSRDLKSNNLKKRNIQVQHKEFGSDWLMIKIKIKTGTTTISSKRAKKPITSLGF